MAGETIKELLLEVDLEKLSRELKNEVANTQGLKQRHAVQRLEIVEAFIASNTRPEWMIADVIPVSAPELRPLTQADIIFKLQSELADLADIIFKLQSELADLKGSSEHDDEDEEDLEEHHKNMKIYYDNLNLNYFYATVIERNNRLKKLMEMNEQAKVDQRGWPGAPEAIIIAEKCLLQNAVDRLFMKLDQKSIEDAV